MSLWSAFYPTLLPHVTGCAEPTMDRALRDSAREFFQRSRAWQQWLTAVTAATGDREYPLPLPTDSQVHQLDRATVNGTPYPVLAWREFCADVDETPGEECGLTTLDRVVFTLSRDLPDGALVKVRATLMPSETSTGIPDDLAVQYREAIVAGARYRLQSTPNKSYSNPDYAALARTEFEAAVGSTAAHAYRSFSSNTSRKRPVWC